MKTIVFIYVLVFAGLAMGEGASLPQKQAGLWQLEISVDMNNIEPQIMKVCIDEQTNADVFGLNPDMPCSEHEVRREGDKYIMDATCKMANSSVVIQTVASGDFQARYTMDIVSLFDPPIAGQSESHQTIKGLWLGACEAGQQPGEAIMEDGAKIRLFDQ